MEQEHDSGKPEGAEIATASMSPRPPTQQATMNVNVSQNSPINADAPSREGSVKPNIALISPANVDLSRGKGATNPNVAPHSPINVDEPSREGAIARLARRELHLITKLHQAGFSTSLPLVYPSEERLVTYLRNWMDQHPGERPPGSTLLHLRKEPNHHIPFTFATTTDVVLPRPFLISGKVGGVLIKDISGQCIYVTRSSSVHGIQGYHGFLGDDQGFTLKPIIHQDKGDDLRVDSNMAKAKSLVSYGTARGREGTEDDDDVVEVSSNTVRDVSQEAIDQLREASGKEPAHLSQHPPVANGAFLAEGFASRQANQQSVPRAPTTTLNRAPSYQHPGAKHLQHTPSSTYPASGTAGPSYSQSSPRPPPTVSVARIPNVIFHFFAEKDRAVPVHVQYCLHSNQFFDKAFEVESLLRPARIEEAMIIGVNVDIEELKWSMLLPWRSETNFKSMVQLAGYMAFKTDGAVHVRVTCLLQGPAHEKDKVAA